jgi:hypothetical protein
MGKQDRPKKANPTASFLKRLPITLVLAMLIWALLRSTLDMVVPAFSQLLIRGFEMPRVTRLVVVPDHRVEVRRADLHVRSGVLTIPLTEVHFNTIVLLALYLALPRPLSRQQLERLFMGWCILYLTQTINLIFHVKLLYATGMGEFSQQVYSQLARNLYGFGKLFTDLPGRFSFPFLIWLGFNWNHVMAAVAGADTQSKSGQTRPQVKKARSRRQ